MEEKKREKWRRREKNGGRIENQGRDSAQNRTNKSTFIHTVSTNYECIYSIPLGVPIFF